MKNFFIKKSKKKSITQLLILLIVVTLITTIVIKRKTINLVIDGKKSSIITYKNTVGTILENSGISVDSKDKITPSLSSQINNNSTISIKRAVTVHITVDGKNLTVKSTENTIDNLLKVEGIILAEKDKVQPLKETVVQADLKVTIVRVGMKTFTESTDIPFNTVTKNDSRLASTVKKTTQVGKPGQKTTVTNVVYEDGAEVSRTVVSETIVKKPVNAVISQGTSVATSKVIAPNTTDLMVTVSRGGASVPYTKILNSKATAYASLNGATARTASGKIAVRDPNGYSTIAVDPKVIPLGSKVYVEGYGLAYAADTGSSIKGNIIDVFFNTLAEAKSWGVKYVNVYVLK